ncbi:SpoIIE family protein phosphatase [Streptomyces sp. NPDC021356]|uniref:PP2C family protein-serine/threonine phosphatase n=1 Tax=Streptomyces sp. NPDC021356 TaxID=3154900 RepID=UPI0033D5B3DB
MCDARRVTGESVPPAEPGAVPEAAAPAEGVAGPPHAEAGRWQAEAYRRHEAAEAAAVVERAKGALMALTGCSPEAAHEDLLRRAKAARRTLVEECRITLGTLVPPLSHATGAGEADGVAVLAELGRALAQAQSPQELAVCLLEHLAAPVGADAVMLCRRQPAGAPVPIGYAATDGAPAERWRHMPAEDGGAALDALVAGEPRWLDDDAAVRPRAGHPGEHRPSRAWLPVPGADYGDVALGVLRTREGPFAPHARELLRGVSWLCAARLRDFGRRPEQAQAGARAAARALFEALPGAALLLIPVRSPAGDVEDYRVDAATAQAAGVLGDAGRDLVGRRFLECWPAAAEEPLKRGWLSVLETGEPYESGPFAQQEAGACGPGLSTYSVRAARLGDALVVTWLRYATSDRQQQRLADLQRLGRLGWATWNLVTDEAAWSPQVYLLCDRDPGLGPVPLAELPGLALPEDAPALDRAVRALLAGGTSCDVPFRIRTTAGVRHLRAVAEPVPDATGAPAEVHGFVQDLTAQRSAELALVESERTMLAQDGILRAERTLAGRLQHALLPLPRRPVRLAGLQVDVAYLPAESGTHVGGDWFSAIELPDGDALFVVGDVAGHGIDAVATMAQLRFTAKGMLFTGSSLTGALARLNTLLLHSRDTKGTATLVLGRYRPAERRLVWAQAGHLPPLLLRRGEPRYLRRPLGVLLGATESPVFEEAECLLEPGDRLLFYTDGLVERPGEDINRGLERLARTARAHHAGAPGSLVPLLTAMLEGERRDDVCVLDIRAPGEPA